MSRSAGATHGTSSGATFVQGAASCAPVALSVIPFAVIFAVSATDAGLSALSTVGLSLFVFAGAAQLTAVELARTDAPAIFILAAAIAVNLRFMVYSASLASYVRDVPARARAGMAYLLTDQAFAMTVNHYQSGRPHGVFFYFGAGLALWAAWQCGTVMGIVLGASVPPELSLDFAVALAFIALAVPAIDGAPALIAALVSIAMFLAASGLPYGLALFPAAVSGMVAGSLAERIRA